MCVETLVCEITTLALESGHIFGDTVLTRELSLNKVFPLGFAVMPLLPLKKRREGWKKLRRAKRKLTMEVTSGLPRPPDTLIQDFWPSKV